jgi:hypothetical protein
MKPANFLLTSLIIPLTNLNQKDYSLFDEVAQPLQLPFTSSMIRKQQDNKTARAVLDVHFNQR